MISQKVTTILCSTLIGTVLASQAAWAVDPYDDARRISRNIGMAAGGALSCDIIPVQRVKALNNQIDLAIRTFSKDRLTIAALQDAFNQGIEQGQQAVTADRAKCPAMLADLSFWETSSTTWFASASGSAVITKAAVTSEVTAPAPAAAPPQPSPPLVIRGVTDREIRMGMAAPFSGPAKELGRQMKLGIETAFNLANDAGGVHGRKVTLATADDGYEPTRTADAMKALYEKEQVFGVIGNVGAPTAAVALPYALSRKMVFFGAFTGAGLLRRDPPDRYVFNYRASYAEETSAVMQYLVKVKRIRPEQIAVFAQQDGYGDAGFEGVMKAMRTLRGNADGASITRLNYQRNTVDVDEAIGQLAQLQRQRPIAPIKAVVMVATYRAAAKFIEKTRDQIPGLTYTNVSFVGSTSLAEELLVLGPKYAAGVIVTQVVPAVESYASVVLDYKAALAKYFPGEAPDYVSLEGYLSANVLIEGLRRTGAQLDAERLVGTLENMRDLDLGLGTMVNYSRADHQASHKVWGTQLDAAGHFQPIDLD